MFCTSCGNKLAEDAKFCSKCGAPVMKNEPQPVYVEPQQPEPVMTPVEPEVLQSELVSIPAAEPQPEPQCSEPAPQPEQSYEEQSQPVPVNIPAEAEATQFEPVVAPVEPKPQWQQPAPQQYAQPAPQWQQPAPQQEPQWQQPYGNSQWQAPEYSTPKKSGRAGLIIGICCGAAAILIVAITMLVIFAGGSRGAGSYADAINRYTDAIAYGKGGKNVDLMHEDYEDYLIEYGYFDSEKELKQSLQSESEWTKMNFAEEYGSNYKVRFVQTDIYHYDYSDLSYFNDDLDYYYDFDSKATDVVTVYYDVYITGSKGSYEDTTYFEAMCIDGRWYMVPDEFGY